MATLPARSFIPLIMVLALLGACGGDEARPRVGAARLYVAIGASDSVGTGARNPGDEGWTAQLHQRMPSGTRFANLGIGGIQSHQAVEQALPVAVDLRPDLVTVWLGVNDLAAGASLDGYAADLDVILSALARDTRARVYVANVPDLTLLPAFRSRDPEALRAEVQRWNAAIAAAAEAHGAVVVDLFTGWSELREHPEYVSRDGLHPSTAGHRRVADLFWQAIQSDA